MDKLEKVEKLRERANVSYEDARTALEENGWDLLDAMVALEKSGKTDAPAQEQYSTSYDQQKEYVSVKTTVENQQKEQQPRFGRTLGEALHNFFRICRENAFCVTRNSELILRIPLFAVIIILLFTWKFSIPILLIALLFGFRYSIDGSGDLKQVNAFMDSAGAAAESLKEGVHNAHERDSRNSNNNTDNSSDNNTDNNSSNNNTDNSSAEV